MRNVKIITSSLALFLLVVFSGCTQAKDNTLKLTGTIEADKFDISSEIAGKIKSINFNEGDKIKAGDLVVNMDTSILEIQKKQAEASTSSLNYKLLDIKSGTRKEQIDQAKANLEQINAQISGQKKILDTLNDNESKLQTLYDGTTDAQKKQDLNSQITELKIKIYSSQTSIDALNAQYEAANSQLKLLQEGATQNTIDAAALSVEQAKASLDLINLQIDKSSIKSIVDGTVIYKFCNAGQVVNVGTPILSLADLNNIYVKFYIPEKNLSKIKLGQDIKLVSDSFSGKTFDGKITFISQEGEFTPKNVQTKEEGSKVYYEFKVKITSNIDELKPGMMIDTVIE